MSGWILYNLSTEGFSTKRTSALKH